MSIITIEKSTLNTHTHSQKRKFFLKVRTFLLSWEVYIILFAAAFLRLYQFGTTEFDDDEGVFFHMAYNAITHGFIPATSYRLSVQVASPPAMIYLLMIPASITSNPIGGAIFVALCAIASVLFTYILVRRYFGRVAGTIAALLYATLFRAVIYSRFIWNPNFLPLFMVLFFIALFWGAVDRRKGWFAPALFLIGIMAQLHPSGLYMIIPLALACLLAPDTIRRRDILIAAIALVIFYSPYLFYEVSIHFKDIRGYFFSNQPATTDLTVLHYYHSFLDPYVALLDQSPLHWKIVPFINAQGLMGKWLPYLSWTSALVVYLVGVSFVAALVIALSAWNAQDGQQSEQRQIGWTWLQPLSKYVQTLRNSPLRCGLVLLLAWQVIPVVFLIRHSTTLYLHYLIFTMPGPCIIPAVILAKALEWLRQRGSFLRVPGLALRSALFALIAVIICAQFAGSLAGVLDLDQGHYSDGSPVNNLYNDLRSLQAAVNEADQVAQQHHLSRVYISTDWPTQSTLRYLSTFMKTPATLFASATQADDHDCIALPDASKGPAVMLIGPYSDFTDALVQRFTSATLIDKPARPGGAPFRLYIVSSPNIQPIAQAKLGKDIQLLNTPAQTVTFKNSPYVITRWSLLRSAEPGYRKVYGYNFIQTSNAQQNNTSQCYFTAMRAGDQILVSFAQTHAQSAFTTASIGAASYEVDPYYLHLGPLIFETYRDDMSPTQMLTTSTRNNTITVSARH